MQEVTITPLEPGTQVVGLWVFWAFVGAVLTVAVLVGFAIGWWWRGRWAPRAGAAAHPTAT